MKRVPIGGALHAGIRGVKSNLRLPAGVGEKNLSGDNIGNSQTHREHDGNNQNRQQKGYAARIFHGWSTKLLLETVV